MLGAESINLAMLMMLQIGYVQDHHNASSSPVGLYVYVHREEIVSIIWFCPGNGHMMMSMSSKFPMDIRYVRRQK